MGAQKPGVAPGVTLTEQFRVRVNFGKVMGWWEGQEEAAYREALGHAGQVGVDPRLRIAWGLILAGLEAAGLHVEQVEETWGVTS